MGTAKAPNQKKGKEGGFEGGDRTEVRDGVEDDVLK